MPDRNDEDTKFVRAKRDAIPTKKYPQTASELSIVQDRKQLFKDMVRGGMETQTSSVADKYFRDSVQCARRFGTGIQSSFQMASSGKASRSG